MLGGTLTRQCAFGGAVFDDLVFAQPGVYSISASAPGLTGLGEVSAMLAHELRNPLAAIKGHAQLLEESLDPANAPRARRVVDQAIRLEAIVNELLDFARAGRVERVPVDIVALVREVAEDEPQVRVEGDAVVWPVDPPKLRAVLRNLLRNARQASPEGAVVTVSVGIDGATLVIVVRDQGHGIAPGDEEKIFTPFYTTRTRGAGLGLAVVIRIVALHGDTVLVRTRPEGGAEFTVRLPAG